MKHLLFSLMLLAACSSKQIVVSQTSPPPPALATWLPAQKLTSWKLLQRNLNPTEPKLSGGPLPLPGAVVAGLSRAKPDYYFHWIRDSANVMNAVAEYLGNENASDLDMRMDRFLTFSRRLQRLPSAHGMGEPRFTVEGTADTSPWSRPQYDGPALRALTIMRYLDRRGESLTPARRRLAREVLKADLDFIAASTLKRGFDVWEEYRADNYNTRLVQLSALENGMRFFEVKSWKALAVQLESLLDDHWDPARKFLRAQLAIAATDGWTTKKTDLDSAILVSVIDADRASLKQSVLDPRVQATIVALEDLFRSAYPINAKGSAGLGFGRYAGDSYFGGNPWPLITAAYAQFYYRIAKRLLQGSALEITPINRRFVEELLGSDMPTPTESLVIKKGHVLFARLIEALLLRGDRIMMRLQEVIPADGDISEQFDKNSGEPVSARGLGWSHGNFLSAVHEREEAMKLLHAK